jgi:hypothetical protein
MFWDLLVGSSLVGMRKIADLIYALGLLAVTRATAPNRGVD